MYNQIKPDPIAKKEYFSQAFCEVQMPSPNARKKKKEENMESDDESDLSGNESDLSDNED